MNSRDRILEIIEEMQDLMLYKDEIAKAKVYSNSIEFKLPIANTDWCNDLFKVISFMTNNYEVYISGECLEPNTILLVNTCTMI